MQHLKDRYQIRETASTLSFRPFYHVRKRLKWYVLAILSFGTLSIHFLELNSETLLIACLTFFLITCWFLIKELVVYIPIKYTFDLPSNVVYQSNLVGRKKIMNIDEIIIFRSSENGTWHYVMGQNRKQFVKSYAISESFPNRPRSHHRVSYYDQEVIARIRQLSDAAHSGNRTNTESVNIT